MSPLPGEEELASDRLDHAYAVTVHRMQGASVDRAHVFADGGGRELANVAMSRARQTSHVYVAADDHDQAIEDLTNEWSIERRQRWLIDTDTVADDTMQRRPGLSRKVPEVIGSAQLRAEREAVEAIARGRRIGSGPSTSNNAWTSWAGAAQAEDSASAAGEEPFGALRVNPRARTPTRGTWSGPRLRWRPRR